MGRSPRNNIIHDFGKKRAAGAPPTSRFSDFPISRFPDFPISQFQDFSNIQNTQNFGIICWSGKNKIDFLKKLWLKDNNMFNKMSKFCKDKKFLKTRLAKIKIKFIKREIKDFEKCYKKMNGYGIKITKRSYIKFAKEDDYKFLLDIEYHTKKLYLNVVERKCTKKIFMKILLL